MKILELFDKSGVKFRVREWCMYLCVCIVLLDNTKIKQTLDFGVAIETYELQENQSMRLTRDSRNNVFLENASKCR
jgi:DNA topoisomerase IB